MKKMLRQGLGVSIEELEQLTKQLKKERRELEIELGVKKGSGGSNFQINIINKQPECSDTWEIEQ